jgi:hypothetical protein
LGKSRIPFDHISSTNQLTNPQLLIGLAYPLYNVFLPIYIRTRGAQLGGLSDSEIWRNYALSNLSSIPSPILAGYMCRSKYFWGRRGTMIIGALVTMAFFFAYTEVKSNAQNLGFTCAISFCLVSLHCSSSCLPFCLLRMLLIYYSIPSVADMHSNRISTTEPFMHTLPKSCPQPTAAPATASRSA